MKFLREYIRILLELECPDADPAGWKVYYDIDGNNPPPIEHILKCWVENNAYVKDSSINNQTPAYYSPEELVPYREYERDRLRSDVGGKYFHELKKSIAEEGIREPLIIFFGKNGLAKIGEGNHRHEIAMSLGLSRIPVRFIFWQNVTMTEPIEDIPEPNEIEAIVLPVDEEPQRELTQEEEQDVEKLMKLLGW